MKRILVSLAAAVALVSAAPVKWAEMISLGTGGSHVYGNAQAKVRLVEYISYTCPHCAEYVADSAEPMKASALIAEGKIAVEVRNLVRDRMDLAAAVMARCGGPAKFRSNTEAIMAAQPQWVPVAFAYDAKNGRALAKTPPNIAIKQVVHAVGLDTVMRSRGFTNAQIDACAVNPAAINSVIAMTKTAGKIVRYTPFFTINGTEAVSVTRWEQLEALMRIRLGNG
jgi:protein-disulfide isomerase